MLIVIILEIKATLSMQPASLTHMMLQIDFSFCGRARLCSFLLHVIVIPFSRPIRQQSSRRYFNRNVAYLIEQMNMREWLYAPNISKCGWRVHRTKLN